MPILQNAHLYKPIKVMQGPTGSARAIDVWRLHADGRSITQIANKLKIHPSTVRGIIVEHWAADKSPSFADDVWQGLPV